MALRNPLREAEQAASDQDQVWPLDVSMIAVASLVMYLIVTKLRFDDPRWLFNAWTYAVAVPLVALALAFALRSMVSRFVQKSIQLGFLFSVCVHLLLLILAINVVIFTNYMQTATPGKQPKRNPVRRTVPEHIFQAPRETNQTPDWSEPTEAETRTRIIPREQRQLPPVRRSEAKLEMPKPKPLEPERPIKKMLMKREQLTPAQPMPADSPGKLSRREMRDHQPTPQANPVQVPDARPRQTENASDSPAERQISMDRPRRSSSKQAPTRPNVNLTAPSFEPRAIDRIPLAAAARPRSESQPRIGAASPTRRSQVQRRRQMSPVASAPAPPAVSIASENPAASRMLSPVDTPITRRGEAAGAQVSMGDIPNDAAEMGRDTAIGSAQASPRDFAQALGSPTIRAGDSPRPAGRSGSSSQSMGFAPVGAPTAADAMVASAVGEDGTGEVDTASDRMGLMDIIRRENAAGQGRESLPEMAQAAGPSMALDIRADVGPIGFADRIAKAPGILPSDEQPEIAAIELSQADRPKRLSGGPATPAGAKVAAVESFSRRVMRTKGGLAAASAGFAGPATEEAIELGLAYLSSTQKPDGSWSLQGHGSDVALQSDTAATGLCLLAFQGAGYTHLQHQYADTVSRGLKFLMDNQRSSGNLYKSENSISDRSVAMYSHGIAALAMSEAYGMTQDPELRQAAQDAIRYIVVTQHQTRGGWRYTPQVSSDTSVSGWMMMALKSGELSGLKVPKNTYAGIDHWLGLAQQNSARPDRYRYNPYAPDTPEQRHGRHPSPTMTAVGMLMRMYSGWRRDHKAMKSAADYLLQHPPRVGTAIQPRRDAYYWYYATQVMFHMGGEHWEEWSRFLNPMLLRDQIKNGPKAGSWDPVTPVPDRWSPHAGRLYVTTMNLLNLEVYYRHLPIYEDTAQ